MSGSLPLREPPPRSDPKIVPDTSVGALWRPPDGFPTRPLTVSRHADTFAGPQLPPHGFLTGTLLFATFVGWGSDDPTSVSDANIKDGFLDLLVGAHERDGDQTSVYWGSSDGDRDLVLNRTRGIQLLRQEIG